MKVGAGVAQSLSSLGEFTLFIRSTLQAVPKFWKRRHLFVRQCEFVGVSSTGIIFIAAIFLGSVLGYQLYASFKIFNAQAFVGSSVGMALFRELGPVMTAILVTGRAGAAIAAQIASMRITEQIDALEVMAVNPMEYLVLPRVVAGVIMVPLLAVFFSSVATLAAAVIACDVMGLSYAIFWKQFMKSVDARELLHCTVKGASFGVILTWVACFFGFRARGGARAVGLATRTTVVASCLTILFSDYFLTSLLPFGFEKLKAY